MTYLRATKKVLSRLPNPDNQSPEHNATALGDWYVNRVVIDRQPLLLLVSSMSLLPILAPARNMRGLPGRLPSMVASRLERLGVNGGLVGAEVRAMDPVHVAATTDRSVLGILTDFSRTLPYYLPAQSWGEQDLFEAERILADTPCYASRKHEETIWPKQRAVELLRRRWSIRLLDDSDRS
jgi:hypothetical protein